MSKLHQIHMALFKGTEGDIYNSVFHTPAWSTIPSKEICPCCQVAKQRNYSLLVLLMLLFYKKDELILKDSLLTDKEYPHRMRTEFINDHNTIVALSAHGPM